MGDFSNESIKHTRIDVGRLWEVAFYHLLPSFEIQQMLPLFVVLDSLSGLGGTKAKA